MGHMTEPASGRLDVLDFMRGIAVLGILVINIESFAYAEAFSPWQFGFASDLDRDFRFWTYFLFQGKFFSMFALLFGVGFYLFLEKAARYGPHAADLYAHRMFWLFVIGVAHACLLWPGDILYHYAVCGLLLLPARAMRTWQLLLCIAVLVALIGWQGISATQRAVEHQARYDSALATPVSQRSEQQHELIARRDSRSLQRAVEPDGDSPRLGGYVANLKANVESVDVGGGTLYYRGILFRTLLLMLSGILLYRLGIFHDYRRLKGYWLIAASVLVLGLAANYSRHWTWTYLYFVPVTDYGVALGHHFSKEILGIAYILVLNGFFQKYLRNFSFSPLACVGRMALTNYLLQSLAAGFIFYGYGLGLHGCVARSELWPFVLAIWSVQLPLSVLWLNRFRQGPVEASWRRMMHWTSQHAAHRDAVAARDVT